MKHWLPKESIESIEFIPALSGESGYMITLNEGFSFDPMSNDYTRFIPQDSKHEALNLVVFTLPAAKNLPAAD